MSYSDETLRRPRKVAFYGRVSTELEAQTAALKSQMEWYHKLAAQYPNWSVVNQYADDGVTGTVKEVRRAFMKMLCDAKEGKFDLIVTREVSRFAANTVGYGGNGARAAAVRRRSVFRHGRYLDDGK